MSNPDPVTTIITAVAATALNQVAKQAADFLAAVTGHKGESIGTILGSTAERRWKNAEAATGSAYLTLLNIGVAAGEIPLKVLQPSLEGASLEEEPSMQEIWGNMMANAADTRRPGFVEPSFPAILKSLTSREVRFLDAFVRKVRAEGGAHTFPDADVEFIAHALKESFDEAGLSTVPISAQPRLPGSIRGEYQIEGDRMGFYMCLDLLISHRLVEKHIRTVTHDALNAASGQAYETFSITALGTSFIRACQPPLQDV